MNLFLFLFSKFQMLLFKKKKLITMIKKKKEKCWGQIKVVVASLAVGFQKMLLENGK